MNQMNTIPNGALEPALEDLAFGKLYRPWWFNPQHAPAAKRPDLLGVVCCLRQVERPVEAFAPTSEVYDVEGAHFNDFLKPEAPALLEDIKVNRQREPIIAIECVPHAADLVMRVGSLKSDPEHTRLRILHGHHRYAVAKHLGRPLKAWVATLLCFPRPMWDRDFQGLYAGHFLERLWTLPQTPYTKGPWFWPKDFESFQETPKFRELEACFAVVRSLGLTLKYGIDIGAAEGAYTLHAQEQLGIPMTGLEAEAARVVRGALYRAKTGKGCELVVGNVEGNLPEVVKGADFGLMLALLHHTAHQEELFGKLAKGKRVMVVELRSVTNDVAAGWFKKRGFKFQLVADKGEDNRKFYVLWKPGAPAGQCF